MIFTASMRRSPIRTRMLATVAAALLMLTLVGGAGMVGMLLVQQNATAFAAGPFADMSDLATLRQHMGDMRRYEKDMVISQGEPSELTAYKTRWEAARAGALASIETMQSRQGGRDGAQLAEIAARLTADVAAAALPMPRIEAGAYDTAAAANRVLSSAKQEAHAAEQAATKLHAEQHRLAEASHAAMQRTTSRNLALFAVAVAASLALIVMLTLLNMRSICALLDAATALANRIAAGDLSHDPAAPGRGETSLLLQTLSRMQHSLRALVGDVRASTDSISTASGEIAMGNQDLSVRTEQTASNLQQTACSMEQLTGTVRQSAESDRRAHV